MLPNQVGTNDWYNVGCEEAGNHSSRRCKGYQSLADFEKQDWYFNLKSLCVSHKKGKTNYTAPEALLNLDADQSVTTLDAKNNARCAAAKGFGDSDSEEEDTDSASDECDIGKLPNGKASDKEEGDGQTSTSWSLDPSSPSDGRLTSRAAAGGG